MYEQFWSQSYHLLHFGFAYFLLLYLWPKLLFPKFSEDKLEQAIVNYLLMALLLLGISMILIAVNLYEFLSVTAILILLTYHKFVSGRRRIDTVPHSNKLATWFFDYFEGLFQLRSVIGAYAKKEKTALTGHLRESVKPGISMGYSILLAVIFGISAYMRFYDAVHSPVPNMSDGWVLLKWIKYAEHRVLYPDGIYPAGYQVFIATVRKFADIDTIYMVKYVGPLNMMFLMVGYYFMISRLTKSKAAGLVAIIVYGILSPIFYSFLYERQASSMSQEFGLAFVCVCLYFYLQYMQTGKRHLLWAATAGTSVTGLSHSIPYVWIGLGMGCMIAVHLVIMGRTNVKRILHLTVAGLITMAVSLAPIITAYLFKVQVYQGVTDFVESEKSTYLHPDLYAMDYIALLFTGLLFLYGCFKKASRLDRLPELFVAIFVLATFLLYYYGVYTKRELIIVRSRDLWYASIPLAIGMGSYVLFRAMTTFRNRRYVELAIVTVFLAISVFKVPPKPIIPYKLESKVTIEQFMKITKMYPSFLIVSPRVQMFPLVYGKGSHMYLQTGSPNLIDDYDPHLIPLTKYGEKKHADVAADIFIFYEKRVFQVDQSESRIYSIEEPKYQRYAQQYQSLQQWIQISKASIPKGDFSVFYDDHDLTIYHLHRHESEEDRKDIVRKIWS